MIRVFFFTKPPSLALADALTARYGYNGTCGGWRTLGGRDLSPPTLHEWLADAWLIPARPRSGYDAPVESDLVNGRCPCVACVKLGRR